MIDLSFHNVTKYYGAELILDSLSFEVKSGDKIGLVGKNGSGKSTLFKIISQIENIESGNISKRKSLTIGYLEQEIKDIENTVKEYIYSGLGHITKILQEMKEYEVQLANVEAFNIDKLLEEYGELQEEYELSGGYNIDEKFNRICNGLKISDDFLLKKMNELSGGEKIKMSLAKVLIQQPEMLLLDEPTNHLDLDSIEWLESFFREYSGTIILVSHDRFFLDNVIHKVFELENLTITEYSGNYSDYIEQKRIQFERDLILYKAQQRKIKSMEEAIVRFRVWGSVGNDKAYKRAENMRKRIDKMDKFNRPKSDSKNMRLSFNSDERFGKGVLKINNLSKSYGNKQILKGLDLNVYRGEKSVIIGKNGSGKSTLLNIITGGVNDYKNGDINIHEKCIPGYISQEPEFDNTDIKIIDYIAEKLATNEANGRKILAQFLFTGNDVFKQIKDLSGGEKVKLKFCELSHSDINFLILDEPTNHLDIPSRDVLENAVNEYQGTLLMVSHDRYFINKTVDNIYELEDGKLEFFDGDFDYYLSKKKSPIVVKTTKKIEKNEVVNKPVAKTKNNYKLNEIAGKISDLEKKIQCLDTEISENSSNAEMLQELCENKVNVQADLDALYDKWMELEG